MKLIHPRTLYCILAFLSNITIKNLHEYQKYYRSYRPLSSRIHTRTHQQRPNYPISQSWWQSQSRSLLIISMPWLSRFHQRIPQNCCSYQRFLEDLWVQLLSLWQCQKNPKWKQLGIHLPAWSQIVPRQHDRSLRYQQIWLLHPRTPLYNLFRR